MQKKKRFGIGGLAILLAVVMTACSGGGGGTTSGGDAGGTGGSGSGGGASTTEPSGGGGSTPQERVTIEYWHTYSDQEEKVLAEQIKPLFEEKHPNIELKLTRMPYEGLKQQVLAAVAGDAAPDLMRMDIVWVPEMAHQGALMRLDEKPGFEVIQSSVFDGALATNYYDGGYYGVPLNTNTKVAIYHKATLEQAGLSAPPKTIDELVAAAKTLKAQGKYGLGVSGMHSWGLLPYFWSLGGSLTNDDYSAVEGYLNSPESIAALQTIADWQKEGLIIPPLMGGEPGAWDGLKSGEYLMVDDGPWFYSILMNEADSPFKPMEETVRALMPAGPAGSHSVIGGEDLVIFANSKHPDEAWTFMQWMLTEEPQSIMATTGLIPTNKTAAGKIDPQSIPFIAEYVEQLNTALPRTPIPQWGEMETIFNLAAEKAIRGEMTAADALNDAAKQIEALLK
ncbi:extracellular solute-binding protein [Paenibacillus antri]|nr:extracellular solute-binding protein [Paenibacillus antri]